MHELGKRLPAGARIRGEKRRSDDAAGGGLSHAKGASTVVGKKCSRGACSQWVGGEAGGVPAGLQCTFA